MARTYPPPVNPLRADTLILTDGRVLTEGDEFTIPGEGRFSFRYAWGTDVTCWGPVNQPKECAMRSFHPSRITTIHRKQIAR